MVCSMYKPVQPHERTGTWQRYKKPRNKRAKKEELTDKTNEAHQATTWRRIARSIDRSYFL